jgi:uncharacterized protein (DUF2267 family)
MSETGLLPFDHALHSSHAMIRELMEEMGWHDSHCAYQALRSVLHALRDHLPIDDVIALGSELPAFVRGSYYEGWHPKRTLRKKPGKTEFLGRVAGRLQTDRSFDLDKVTHGVFKVLERHVTHREMEAIKRHLPADMLYLFDSHRFA